MPTPQPSTPTPPAPREWILVSDTNSKVLKSSHDRYELMRIANVIRYAGGQVTIFRSTKL